MQATISLNLPQRAYQQLELLAEAQQRSATEVAEGFVIQKIGVPVLEPDLETELAAMDKLSNEMLVTFAQTKLSQHDANELETLLALDAKTEAETQRLEALVELTDRTMLRKATALDILRDRGQDIESILSAA